uniref:GH10 domain-containing protein n=1 Tax=Solanum lycopersicum TaxID=4081 RepID=A0A3Q7EVW8_SOLLC
MIAMGPREEPIYDHSAYTECKSVPEDALYNGGIMKDYRTNENKVIRSETNSYNFVLNNLSGWIRILDADSAVMKASLKTDDGTVKCVGNVIARAGCWSFLKGGFVLDLPSSYGLLYLQRSDGEKLNISISSVSLQPFTYQQWKKNQQDAIDKGRKCTAIIHISDVQGERVPGASIIIEQLSRDFPFGSAITKTILGNPAYQTWFKERYNAAVFEDELKWYSTENQQGVVNYTIPDQMLEFVRKNQIITRGHNIFWEDPRYIPSWVRNLTGPDLKSAVTSRIQSLMNKYKNEFIHWDVDNEMLHYDFYEQRLGINTSLEFFQTAQQLDPLAKLFMNDYNVVETCYDMNSTVDAYISKLRDLKQGGIFMDGIGLEGHFTVPNPPLIRAVLDKLATLKLPIWLTEVDISKNLDKETQVRARYLEMVLREGFSHPGVNGIMLWTGLHSNGCYQMCLTDNDFHNLPAGDIVDNLLKEWQTGVVHGETDEHGEYKINVKSGNRTTNSTFSLYRGDDTRHLNIHL